MSLPSRGEAESLVMGETFATVTVVWRSYRALYFYARACTSMIVAACSRHDHDFASKTNARRALLLSSTPRIRIFVGTFGKYTNARPLVGSKRDNSVNIWQISGWREEKGGGGGGCDDRHACVTRNTDSREGKKAGIKVEISSNRVRIDALSRHRQPFFPPFAGRRRKEISDQEKWNYSNWFIYD